MYEGEASSTEEEKYDQQCYSKSTDDEYSATYSANET
jgi:hypothetical protein